MGPGWVNSDFFNSLSHKQTFAGTLDAPGHLLSKARPITYAASRTQASMTALFWRGGLSGSNGCLLADFAQDFVEETKRFPHFGPVALTMPFIVQLLALA